MSVFIVGTVVSGYQVASGRAKDSPYPSGTIAMQAPHFRRLGIDLLAFHSATLNVSIAPAVFALQPKVTLPLVKWSRRHDPESFSFVTIQLTWQQQSFDGLIYYPHPETKINHFQDPSVLELLLPHIQGITYGDQVTLTASADELIIR